ncbi:T6SS immunity protein Tdi1 domain-containing protein [Enterovibrio norvegicus]|uniref:T6SS immunity protein Tdi1 C-terminal domain-containing protein n=1 Tax=Enterovibrio norvegicus DSM 15893 TaxID=1121869 RepID=A0A1I5JHX0_9GAMM|nr:T6SS immunity protein Tdi1 domain-containing protein [Enterovibrio norvegicus]SFO72392.1 protein of unknown function [Enterovibrio norvegicus DSM 15893]
MDLVAEINASWGWVGLNAIEVVAENDFGNLIVKDDESRYWRIFPEELACEIVAANRQELDLLSNDQEFLQDWNMRVLVSVAKEALGELTENKKYCFVIPASLGGEYNASNFKTIALVELIRFSGDLAHQIKDLPPGSKIKLNVE